jgi:hypothetical protein
MIVSSFCRFVVRLSESAVVLANKIKEIRLNILYKEDNSPVEGIGKRFRILFDME